MFLISSIRCCCLQSFGLPPLKVKPTPSEKFASYDDLAGIPNLMLDGFTSAKAKVEPVHPLYHSEKGVSNVNDCNVQKIQNFFKFSTERIGNSWI